MSDRLHSTVDFIRDIIRNEGVTEDSINYTVTFFLCRILDKKMCRRLNILEKYCFDKLLELEEQELFNTLYNPGKDCLFRCFTTVLGLSFLRDFKLKSPASLYKIIHYLKDLDVSSLEQQYDLLGTIYEYHLQTGSSNARDLGQYFTSRPVIDFMVKLVSPRKKDIVIDPTMGTGGFLTMAAKYGADKLIGYDISEKVVSLANINLLLETGELGKVYKRDVLKKGIDECDIILSNIPMGLKVDYNSCCSAIKDLRIKSTKADPLFIQLYISSLKKHGKAAIIVPLGFLFGSNYKLTRKLLLETCDVKKIIMLGAKTFINTKVKTAILYFHKGEQTSQVTFSSLEQEEEILYSISVEEIAQTGYRLDPDAYCTETITPKFPFVPLGKACEFFPKSKHRASYGVTERDEEHPVPFYTCAKNPKYCKEADYDEECILIGDGGKAIIHIDNHFSSSDHIYVAQCKDPRLNNKFIYFYLSHNLHILQDGFRGIGKENVPKSYIEAINIPILSREIQDNLKQAAQEVEEEEVKVKEAVKKLEEKKDQLKELWKEIGEFPLPKVSPIKLNLTKKLDNLREGKVLDVSNMKEDGSGARIIKAPGSRSTKLGHEDLPIVSNNEKTYLLALDMLKEEGKDYSYCSEIWE